MGCIGIGISPQSNMAIGKSQGFELGRSTRKTIGFPSHVSGGHRRKHLRDQTPFFWPSLRITIAGKGTVKIYTEYRISSLKKRTMFEAECFDWFLPILLNSWLFMATGPNSSPQISRFLHPHVHCLPIGLNAPMLGNTGKDGVFVKFHDLRIGSRLKNTSSYPNSQHNVWFIFRVFISWVHISVV